MLLGDPSLISISNQSIVDQNYIENQDLVGTVDFRVQSTVSWERFIALGKHVRLEIYIERVLIKR